VNVFESMRRSARRATIGSLALAVLMLAWIVPAAQPRGSSLDALPAKGNSRPGVTPRPCKWNTKTTILGTNDSDDERDYYDDSAICVYGGDDTVTVTHKTTTVWGGYGNDTIIDRNGVPNLYIGEAGVDRVLNFDPKEDRFCQGDWNRCSRTSRRAADSGMAQAPSYDYPYTPPTVTCINNNGTWQMYFSREPQMRALDSTQLVDWQYVAWSPVLFKLNEVTQQWEFARQNEWLWDLTYDPQVAAFAGNTWRRFTTNAEPWRTWMNIFAPGEYRIAVRYYHYAVGNVPAYSQYDWVPHVVNNTSYKWCVFGK
jgi:hypothetical protein